MLNKCAIKKDKRDTMMVGQVDIPVLRGVIKESIPLKMEIDWRHELNEVTGQRKKLSGRENEV